MSHNVARADGVHVLSEMCETCIFRPGNLMGLKAGRVRGMVDDAKRDESAIICHSTLRDRRLHAVCRGYYDRHAFDVFPLRLAIAFDRVIFDPPPPKE